MSYEQDQHDDVYVEDERIATCGFCGLITPKCDCEIAVERRVNAAKPWPTDPAALTESEATTLRDLRFDFRRREREAR